MPNVFKWMVRQKRPVRAIEISAEFNCDPQSTSQVLIRLRRANAIHRIGRTVGSRWAVINPRADVQGGKGLHPNSLNNLRNHWKRISKKKRANAGTFGECELARLWTFSIDRNQES